MCDEDIPVDFRGDLRQLSSALLQANEKGHPDWVIFGW